MSWTTVTRVPHHAHREFVLPFPTHTVHVGTAEVLGHAYADDQDPHWATLWPAAVALADALLARRFCLPAGDALEIGCGTGLTAIALALAGGRVCASDRVPAALELVRMNAEGNGVGDRITTAMLDWCVPPPAQWPLILGADVLYQPAAGRQVAGFLAAALRDDGVALICDPDRPTARHFHLIAQEVGLTVEVHRLPVPFIDTHGPVTRLTSTCSPLMVTLFVLRRRSSRPIATVVRTPADG